MGVLPTALDDLTKSSWAFREILNTSTKNTPEWRELTQKKLWATNKLRDLRLAA
jgi:hypothetical protein